MTEEELFEEELATLPLTEQAKRRHDFLLRQKRENMETRRTQKAADLKQRQEQTAKRQRAGGRKRERKLAAARERQAQWDMAGQLVQHRDKARAKAGRLKEHEAAALRRAELRQRNRHIHAAKLDVGHRPR